MELMPQHEDGVGPSIIQQMLIANGYKLSAILLPTSSTEMRYVLQLEDLTCRDTRSSEIESHSPLLKHSWEVSLSTQNLLRGLNLAMLTTVQKPTLLRTNMETGEADKVLATTLSRMSRECARAQALAKSSTRTLKNMSASMGRTKRSFSPDNQREDGKWRCFGSSAPPELENRLKPNESVTLTESPLIANRRPSGGTVTTESTQSSSTISAPPGVSHSMTYSASAMNTPFKSRLREPLEDFAPEGLFSPALNAGILSTPASANAFLNFAEESPRRAALEWRFREFLEPWSCNCPDQKHALTGWCPSLMQ